MDTPPQLPAESHKGKSSPGHPSRRGGSAFVRALIVVLVLAVVVEAAGTGYNVLVARGIVRGAELPAPPFVRVSVSSHATSSTSAHQAGTPTANATQQAPDYVELWLTQTPQKVATDPNYAFMNTGNNYQDEHQHNVRPGSEIEAVGGTAEVGRILETYTPDGVNVRVIYGIYGPDGRTPALSVITLGSTDDFPTPRLSIDEQTGDSLILGGGVGASFGPVTINGQPLDERDIEAVIRYLNSQAGAVSWALLEPDTIPLQFVRDHSVATTALENYLQSGRVKPSSVVDSEAAALNIPDNQLPAAGLLVLAHI